MELSLNGKRAHAATGGIAAKPGAPVLVLIHGAGMNGSVWQMQSRYLAARGIRVLAINLPGHGGSEGPALATVATMADWVADFMREAEIKAAVVAGHSMGSLIALELAARHAEKVRSLVLLGTAAEMPVHPDLIAAAEAGSDLAPELVVDWGFGRVAHAGGHPQPGLWVMGAAERLLANADAGILASDLIACASYKDALARATDIKCPVHLVLGDEDKMTPVKNAAPLIERLASCQKTLLTKTGHMMMLERPREIAKLLRTISEA
ncbi:MAG: alpha/beta hydrolase [Proteobacteria bacterium]|nr:alpha/beta hydrolase [Pseudomonadota bacterium]